MNVSTLGFFAFLIIIYIYNNRNHTLGRNIVHKILILRLIQSDLLQLYKKHYRLMKTYLMKYNKQENTFAKYFNANPKIWTRGSMRLYNSNISVLARA